MRLAFLSIPHFPCAVETWRRPELADRPLIVGDAEQPKRVLDCSQAAAATAVQPGMAIRKALVQCPDAFLLPPDPVLYRRLWEDILDALGEITPEIEDEEYGRAYLNVGGLGGHYRDEEALGRRILEIVEAASDLKAAVGIAEGKFPAFAAAMMAGAGTTAFVPDGESASFLAPMPLALLPIDPEIAGRLRTFGFETIGEVARLTYLDLQSQFGFAAKRLWQLVNGNDEERLRPRPFSETLIDSVSFDAPVAGIEIMIAVTRELLSRLRPDMKGRAARELTIQAELASDRGWEKRLVFREAVSEEARLFYVLRASLQNSPPPQAVRSLSLRLRGLTGETGKQIALGDRGRLQSQVEETIRQLKARYGYSPIFRCVDVEPWSVIPEERQILVESDV